MRYAIGCFCSGSRRQSFDTNAAAVMCAKGLCHRIVGATDANSVQLLCSWNVQGSCWVQSCCFCSVEPSMRIAPTHMGAPLSLACMYRTRARFQLCPILPALHHFASAWHSSSPIGIWPPPRSRATTDDGTCPSLVGLPLAPNGLGRMPKVTRPELMTRNPNAHVIQLAAPSHIRGTSTCCTWAIVRCRSTWTRSCGTWPGLCAASCSPGSTCTGGQRRLSVSCTEAGTLLQGCSTCAHALPALNGKQA